MTSLIDHKLEGSVLGSALNNHLIAAELCQMSDGFFALREHNILHSVIKKCVQSTGECSLAGIRAFMLNIPDAESLEPYFTKLDTDRGFITSAGAQEAIIQLHENYKKRKVKESAEIMISEINNGIEADDAKANHEKRMNDIQTADCSYKSARSYDVEDLFKRDPCLKTGITALDAGIIGIPLCQKSIIAARPSVGKTAFALAWMMKQAKADKHGFFVSQETQIRPLLQRMLAGELNINLSKFRTACFSEKEQNEIREFYGKAKWIDNIHIYDKPCDMNKLFILARKAYEFHGIKYVCVDHAGLIQGMNEKYVRRDQIAEYSAFNRKFVSDFPVAWVDLWQLNRDAAEEKAPGMHQLRDSGSAEQDADLILILSATKEDKQNNRLNIEVTKQRQGETFSLSMDNNNAVYFDRSKMIIGDSPRVLEY